MHPNRRSSGNELLALSSKKDEVRRLVVLLSAIAAVMGSFIGSGAAGGTPIAQAAGGALGPNATLMAPAVPAFGVWSVIYLGSCAYAVWQILPGRALSTRQRRLGYPVAASLLLNAGWIFAIQAGNLALSVAVIALLVAVLSWIFTLCVRMRPQSLVEAAICDGTLGLYLGWICVAAAANVSALLVTVGFSGWGIQPAVWAWFVLAVAGLIGVGLAVYGQGRLAPAATLIWGLGWVAVSRLSGDLPSVPAALAAMIAAVGVAVVTLAVRFARGRRVNLKSSRLPSASASVRGCAL
ncbi:tryptophan-rich sensory protein [Paenarthrobacter sp. PH39-S1]|uniref:tryptophan-rich sensory protein n=1 Tax=Paenarthrobacter sp. PH39-S1 TaxID=3046204 RepID=UPI0024BA8C2C|nr:tryptophan-rich sensory protein [Paenarthrobacter sp. PH39-S1]MDJ0355913.1 tryptophan-rich sensory protein [Paenarthrobacter sp. PH39-S1]